MSEPIISEISRGRRLRGLAEQSTSANLAERPGAASDEIERALVGVGLELDEWLPKTCISRDVWEQTKDLVNRASRPWLAAMMSVYQERCILDPGTPEYDRASAFDVWAAMGRFFMEYAPLPQVPVYLTLYKVFRAAGAPLPKDYEIATRIRKRIEDKVRTALDDDPSMRDG